MADPHMSSQVPSTLQTHRMITQLQTQLSVIAMHCSDLSKLCSERDDPRKVELKCSVLKDEERDICSLLRELIALKSKLKTSDQQQLDARLRPLGDEYSSVIRKFQKAVLQAHEYCSQVRFMNASQKRESRQDDPPQKINLGAGLGAAMLLEDDPLLGEAAIFDQELERDVGQLSEMFHLLLEHTTDQGQRIDTLEAHMEAAAEEARAGAVKLTQAAKLSAATVPIAGALLGGALFGPLGMLAGLKGASALTAAVGMGAGYLTGSWYRKRVAASADAARDELEGKRK